MSSPPRLWTFRLSPFAGKVRAAFAEKGVALELREIHIARRPARLAELNPTNRVPVLEPGAGALPIRESSVICEWLEETHPEPPLWPADAALRGWARGTARWIDDGPTADFFLGMRKQAYGAAGGDPQDVVARLHERVTRAWPRLEELLGTCDGPWLCGAQLTYADLSGLPLAVRVAAWKPELSPGAADFPAVHAWLGALAARESAAALDAAGERVDGE